MVSCGWLVLWFERVLAPERERPGLNNLHSGPSVLLLPNP